VRSKALRALVQRLRAVPLGSRLMTAKYTHFSAACSLGKCPRARTARRIRALMLSIESTFATVRNRSKITKGPGSRAAGIAMAYKLIEAAQARWRAVNAPHLVALVRAGAKFENGKLVERPDEPTTEEAA
jgi:hypothetical protein